MKIIACIPLLIASVVPFATPCHAVVITLDPLSNDTNVYGRWHQRRLGSDDGTWWLPGNMLLELGLSREGRLPVSENAPIDVGRWDGVSFRLTATGAPFEGHPYASFYNNADNLTDDFQSLTTLRSNGYSYTFSFAGNYFPTSDVWDGTFSAVVSQASRVPEGGGTLVLLCGALVGILNLRHRWI